MKTKLLLTLFFLTIFSNTILLFGNTAIELAGKISGKIIDEKTGAALEYVSVALYQANSNVPVLGTITNADGSFLIEKIDTGTYELRVTFIGYGQKTLPTIELSKKNSKVDVGTINLSMATTELSEVKVVGVTSNIEYKIDKRVVNVDKNLTAKGGTAVTVLENTPSMQVDDQGNLTLRGSSDFIVLIDGKPSVLKGNDALKQIPSSAIRQIEVITNPSAKYDADGQVGIINVILKKEKLQGFSGNLNAGISNKTRNNGNALINFRKGKWNAFAGFDYSDNTFNTDVEIDSKTSVETDTNFTKGNTRLFSDNKNLSGRIGVDWEPNEKNSFSISGQFGRQGYDNGAFGDNSSWTSDENSTSIILNDNYMDVSGDIVNATVDYKRVFNEKSNLLISNYYGSWRGVDHNIMKESVTDDISNPQPLSPIQDYTKDNSNYNIRTNVDFTCPAWSGKLEAGVQYRVEDRTEDMEYQYKTNPDSNWLLSDRYSYHLDYINTIYSGYAIYSSEVKGLGFQVGLRSEYFTRTMELSNETSSLNYNKFMFYPSVHFSKTLREKYQFQLSYSRRIQRPQPWVLNTTPKYIDAGNIFLGNTELIPEYTDAFELNGRTTLNKFTFSVQTYFRNTTHPFEDNRYLDGEGILVHKLDNGKYRHSLGAEIGIDVNPFKWWQINSGVNVYNYKLSATISDEDRTQQVNTWDGRLVNTFMLKWQTRIQAVAYYRAPSVDATGESTGFFVGNLAVYQSFYEGKLNLSLSGQNVFNSVVYDYSTQGKGYDNTYVLKSVGLSIPLA